MSIQFILLIFISAIFHLTWNALLKKSKDKQIHMSLALIGLTILLTPLALFILSTIEITKQDWIYMTGTGLIHGFYFFTLALAYKYANLNLVYPVTRGLGAALVPIFAVFILDESITQFIIIAVAILFLGVFIINSNNIIQITTKTKTILHKGTYFALITALLSASYQIWDKNAMNSSNSLSEVFIYMYFMLFFSAILISIFTLASKKMFSIKTIAYNSRYSILATGILIFLAYGIIVAIMQFIPISLLAPSREIGTALGIIAAVIFFKEKLSAQRIIGIIAIIIGLILIAIANN